MWEVEHKECWVPKNWCFWIVLLEKTWESHGQQGHKTSQSGNQLWYSLEELMLKLKLLILWYEELTHWKRPWCWERLRAKEEGNEIGWDGWMASQTQCTWVSTNSGRLWRTGKSGMLVVHGIAKGQTQHNWTTMVLGNDFRGDSWIIWPDWSSGK